MVARNFGRTTQSLVFIGCLAYLVCRAGSADPPALANDWAVELYFGENSPWWDADEWRCAATVDSSGKIKITRRSGRPRHDSVAYENDSASPQLLQLVLEAAKAAIDEPRNPPRRVEDGGEVKLVYRSGGVVKQRINPN